MKTSPPCQVIKKKGAILVVWAMLNGLQLCSGERVVTAVDNPAEYQPCEGDDCRDQGTVLLQSNHVESKAVTDLMEDTHVQAVKVKNLHQTAPVTYQEGTIENAETLSAHDSYDSLQAAQQACDADTTCKGYFLHTYNGQYNILGPGTRSWSPGSPDFVSSVWVKMQTQPQPPQQPAPATYHEGYILNADPLSGHNAYDSGQAAQQACNAETTCKGYYLHVDGNYYIMGPGASNWAHFWPDYTVVSVFVKMTPQPTPAPTTAWAFVGNGWCLSGVSRIGMYSTWKSSAVRSDGGSDLCETECSADPHCTGYMTEDGSKCQLMPGTTWGINSDQIDAVDGETRNYCWKK